MSIKYETIIFVKLNQKEADKLITQFGKFCRKLRIDHDEQLKDMASKLGITSSYLSAIENGKRRVTPEIMKEVAHVYELTEEQLNELSRIGTLNDLTDREKEILTEVIHVIWLDDRSDYIDCLWTVIKILLGDKTVESKNFDLEAWKRLLI